MNPTFGLLAFGPATGEPPSLARTALHALGPMLGYVLLAPVAALLFRRTWRELDVEAHEHQAKRLAEGGQDFRPHVLFVVTAAVLTLQEYYGGRDFFVNHIRPWLRDQEALGPASLFGLGPKLQVRKFAELYSYGWWAFARVFGYVAIPMIVWKAVFRRDSLLDMGLRVRGLWKHAWIYLGCLAIVVPAVVVVSYTSDFADYYPFYKLSSRSWLDFMIWEAMYFAQFFALEIFFRGFWLAGLRKSMGSSAIFAMAVPYCMIHFDKPYLETCGAVVAGMVLGTVSMRTRSIYSGFIVHITVALLMDALALHHRNGLPRVFWPA